MHSEAPPSRNAPVLVIGGTRSTGLHAVHVLQRRGITVRVLARKPDTASKRVGPGAEIVAGDLTKKDTLVSAVDGVSHIILTAGVRSGRFARESVVKATEYDGILNTIAAARLQGFGGRLVYMTSIGVTRRSVFSVALNIWKGNTLLWRRRAEDEIRASGLEYCIVRAAFLLNRPATQRAIRVSQHESPLTLHECIARADVAEVLVEALFHPNTSRATFQIKWDSGPRQQSSWSTLLNDVRPDVVLGRA